MTEQDTTTCAICGNPLDHTPRLGEWIAHDRCRDAVLLRVKEAQQRSVRMTANHIAQIVKDLSINRVEDVGGVVFTDELLTAIDRDFHD